MIGIGTVLADDPMLTVRLPGLEHRSPIVVIDSGLRTPPSARIVTTAADVPTWIVAGETAPIEPERGPGGCRRRGHARRGSRRSREPVRGADSWAPADGQRLFSEGGPAIGESLIEADLVDTFALATSQCLWASPAFRRWARCSNRHSSRTSAISIPRTSEPISWISSRGPLMFTGIVTDVGEIVSAEGAGDTHAPADPLVLRSGDDHARRLHRLQGHA